MSGVFGGVVAGEPAVYALLSKNGVDVHLQVRRRPRFRTDASRSKPTCICMSPTSIRITRRSSRAVSRCCVRSSPPKTTACVTSCWSTGRQSSGVRFAEDDVIKGRFAMLRQVVRDVVPRRLRADEDVIPGRMRGSVSSSRPEY